MKVINNTDWNTKQLKALCMAVIKRVGSHKKHIIYIEYKKLRRCYYHGRASINGNLITMYVPRLFTKEIIVNAEGKLVYGSDGNVLRQGQPVEFDSESFAQVLEHEIGHNLGLLHDTMLPVTKINAKYAMEYPVIAKVLKEKPLINIKQQRAEQARQRLHLYQSKLKRIAKLVKKYEKKVKYYSNNIQGENNEM